MSEAIQILRQNSVEIDASDHRSPEDILQSLQELGVLAVGTKRDELPYFVR